MNLFLLAFHSNYVPILHCFWDIARCWLKIADCNLPCLYVTPSLEVTLVEFCRNLWHQNTRVPVLSYNIVCIILSLAVLVEHRLVTDGQTHDDSIYCASIAVRGKDDW